MDLLRGQQPLLEKHGLLHCWWGVMESRDLEILHWQGMFDSYLVNMFWKYVDFWLPVDMWNFFGKNQNWRCWHAIHSSCWEFSGYPLFVNLLWRAEGGFKEPPLILVQVKKRLFIISYTLSEKSLIENENKKISYL